MATSNPAQPATRGFTLTRLEAQIKFHDTRSDQNQTAYRITRAVVIVSAALVPIALLAGLPLWVAGAAGGVVTAVEAWSHVNQYHRLWTAYRTTCELLRREQHLYTALVGAYAAAADPDKLLAEQLEKILDVTHKEWLSVRDADPKGNLPQN